MIHPQAIVDPRARLGENVSVGAYSVIGAEVEIGDDTWIGPHAVVNGPARIGRGNRIYQFCSLGEAPQHVGYRGEPTRLTLGDRNVIREFCTLNRGTAEGRGETVIGHDNFFMAYVHVAHDCTVEDGVTLANAVQLAGHVHVEAHATVSGLTPVHQFVRIGTHAFVGGGSRVPQDVPPYTRSAGNPLRLYGINTIGLTRAGFPAETRRALQHAYLSLIHI